VKGAPLELNEQHDRWFYFDQAGVLTKKLGIKQVPSIVTQYGQLLKIQEVKL
jgi:conjugal transfer pilus assembly protein TraW